MRFHEIFRNQWKSWTASWNRVKLSLRESLWWQRPFQAANLQPMKSMKSYEIVRNTYKSMKMHEIHKISWNLQKSMKIDEKATSWNRVKLSLGESLGWQRPFQAANLQPMKAMKSNEIVRNTYKSMKMHKIHEISWNL